MRKTRDGQRKLTDKQREHITQSWADAVAEAAAHPELAAERRERAKRESLELHAKFRGTGA